MHIRQRPLAPADSGHRIETALFGMKVTQVQDPAIQARVALIVGVSKYDRLFAGIRFA
jgi:hypothetical protein